MFASDVVAAVNCVEHEREKCISHFAAVDTGFKIAGVRHCHHGLVADLIEDVCKLFHCIGIGGDLIIDCAGGHFASVFEDVIVSAVTVVNDCV